MTRPLLLLDIDGVLNPLGVREAAGFIEHQVGGMTVLLSPAHGRWLTALAERFDLVWATSWEQDADLLIADLVGIPRGLPYITFTNQSGWTAKLPDVDRYVGDRAVAWIDDQIGPAEEAWAAERSSPTLLVRTDQRVGLTTEHVDQLLEFARTIQRD